MTNLYRVVCLFVVFFIAPTMGHFYAALVVFAFASYAYSKIVKHQKEILAALGAHRQKVLQSMV